MHNFQASYNKILEVLNQLSISDHYLFQIITPKLLDKELIAINSTSEYMRFDSEYHLLRVLPKSSRIERSALFTIVENVNSLIFKSRLDKN